MNGIFWIVDWRHADPTPYLPLGLWWIFIILGLTAMIVCQAMMNLGVVLAMLPTKGMPLPFVSYGGTAMVTALAATGVLLNVSQHRT